MSRSSWPKLLLLLLCGSIILRIVLALRPGLWADEIFSLAMATGHSLEQPASQADPSLGDFTEPRGVESPDVFRRYAEPTTPPAGPRRVIRAVLLSDTSPPLYYLLLNAWTRPFGSGDGALRLFSLVWAVLSLPFLWLLGRELGGTRMAWSATLLFAFSPVSLFYSVEGRMYSLLWFLASALAWQTLRLSRQGLRPAQMFLWVALAAAGLLTHYFFLFVFAAFAGWLLLFPRRLRRGFSVALTCLAALSVAVWYVQVPASLARWRVSGNWLSEPLHWPKTVTRPFELAWSLLAGGSFWGGSPVVDGGLAALYLLLGLWILRRGLLRRVFTRRHLLVWGWVVAAVMGPFVFDLVRHTSASLVTRYVLPGLPAAMLLASLGMRQLSRRAHATFLTVVLIGWTAGAWPMVSHRARPGAVYPAVDAHLETWVRPSDLVLVHSIPSGVIGMGRYFTQDVPMASWIAPLGLRQVPGDLEYLLAGRRRLALVQVHNLAQPSPAEPWLRAHTRLVAHEVYDGARDVLTTDLTSLPPSQLAAMEEHKLIEISYFEPSEGETFFPASGKRR